MNIKLVLKIIAKVLLIEAAFMIIPLIITVCDKDTPDMIAFIITVLATALFSGIMLLFTRKCKTDFYAAEGFITTGLSWVFMSGFGALPFVISGAIPKYVDAWFEIVSGFTTTGATILADVESLSRGILYWRSFSHWLGGMGVLVFLLAVIPAVSGRDSGSNIYLLRAESPGPSVGKLVPKMRQTAAILYIIYIVLTVLNVIFLCCGGMPLFDSVCLAFGTAGTGGFGIKNDSFGSYSSYIQIVTTVFMVLFGVNFNVYFLIYSKKLKEAFKSEELWCYLGIFAVSVALIAANIFRLYGSVGEAIKHSAFQTASIMSTTGFATTDFELWPAFSKTLLLFLMCIGASAGSTGGGFKVVRLLIMIKGIKSVIIKTLNPNRIEVVRISKRPVTDHTVHGVMAYIALYCSIVALSVVIISLDGFSIGTNISATIACVNNIGPGFEAVGATCNYSGYGMLSKIVLSLDMLLGRLEFFPLVVMLTRPAWKRNR